MSAPRTVADAAAALRDRSVSSVELLAEVTARADALDGELGVYIERLDEAAAATAAQADADFAAGVDRGPLQGIPVGVKDILAVAEGATTAQSLVLDPEWGAQRDAVAVERLKASGAVITGKLSTMEFAAGLPDPDRHFPLPRNPWDPERWPGGSSSGTGAGVASGMMLAGLGTDTGGSIRLPSIFCGITGFKPTYGRVPNAGCVPLGYSLDHIGPLARTARDCALTLAPLIGPDPRDPYTADVPPPDLLGRATGSLEGLRIGVERANHLGVHDDEDPAAEPAFEAMLGELRARGATLVDVVVPYHAEVSIAVFLTLIAEAAAYHRNDLRDRIADFSPGNQGFFLLASMFSAPDYVQAQRVRRVAQRRLTELMRDVDAIVMPGATRVAPLYEEVLTTTVPDILRRTYTVYWNAVGVPVMVAPIGFNADGLPLSLQLATRPFEEDVAVAIVDAYQQATDWHLRVPPAVATV